MTRKAGDRYLCSECGSTLVYEKDCPCCSESDHAEKCCDKPMDKVTA
jgi:transposase-like protein